MGLDGSVCNQEPLGGGDRHQALYPRRHGHVTVARPGCAPQPPSRHRTGQPLLLRFPAQSLLLKF
jgi:hypothetical protein